MPSFGRFNGGALGGAGRQGGAGGGYGPNSVLAKLASHTLYDMPKWRRAVTSARAGIAPALIAFLGDSKTAGQGAGSGSSGVTGARRRSVPVRVADILNRRFLAATADSWCGDQNIGAVAGYSGAAGYALYDSSVAVAGGGAWAPDVSPSTFGGRFWIGTSGGAGTLTLTPASTVFDTVAALYARTGSSATSLPVTIGGVAQTAINTRGSNDVGITTFAGVTPGPIQFGAPTGGNAFVVGGYAYNSSNPGIVILQGGVCGGTAGDLSFSAAGYNSLPALRALSPALTFVKAMTNNVNNGTSVDTWAAQIQTIVTQLKTVGDVVLVIDTPGNAANYTNGLYESYAAKVMELGVSNSVNVLDLRDVTAATYAESNAAGYNYDAISHMSALGYSAEAELLAALAMSVS